MGQDDGQRYSLFNTIVGHSEFVPSIDVVVATMHEGVRSSVGKDGRMGHLRNLVAWVHICHVTISSSKNFTEY